MVFKKKYFMKEKAVILLSAGLDSAVNLALGKGEGGLVLALTFDYGQRARVRELLFARKLAWFYEIPHQVVSLPWFRDLGFSALTRRQAALPQLSSLEQASPETARAVWLPNRNGVFVNIAAALAESLAAGWLLFGGNLEEARTFPDNSAGFVEAVNSSLSFSTLSRVKLKSFTQELNKAEIIKKALDLKLPLEYIWSCYRGGEKMCQKCESCLRLLSGAKTAGLTAGELARFNF